MLSDRLSKRELRRAEEVLGDIQKEVTIIISGDRGEIYDAMRTFLEGISDLSGKLRIVEGEATGLPGFTLGGNIHYHALPIKQELDPFLDTLQWVSKGVTDLKPETKEELKKVGSPVDIKVFITPPCPYCGHVVRTANRFAIENENIQVTVIDVTLFPEHLERFRVYSTPKTLLNGELELLGDLREEDLLGWVFKPGTREGRIASRLQKGEAEAIAREALEDERIAALLAGLAFDPDFGLRIGAVVTLEEIMALDPGAALPALPHVLEKLKAPDKRDRGDAAYLLGVLGDESVIKYLESLLEEEDTFLRETAQEAIEAIKAR